MIIGQFASMILSQTIGFQMKKNILGEICFMMILFSIQEEIFPFVIV